MTIKVHVGTFQPMDRAAHRWDSCCRASWLHSWSNFHSGLSALIREPHWFEVKWMWWATESWLQIIFTGKCFWHGLDTEKEPIFGEEVPGVEGQL
jgi:hypothetical protein